MRWIKLYGNTLNDKRLLELRSDHGFLGVGAYFALLIQVECVGEGAQHIDQLSGIFTGKVSRRLIQKIIYAYGLFSVDELGMVRSNGTLPGYSPDDLAELRRTDAIVPSAGTELMGGDQTRQDEIITTMRFRRPSVEEVRAYCQERHNSVDAEQFVDYYESKGWRVGHNPMKDWKACVRTWERKRAFRNDTLRYDNDALHYDNSVTHQDGPPIPDDAPPRPSPRAQWDFATNSWNEFY